MFKVLLKTRIQALISSILKGSKNAKKRSPLLKIGVAALFIYVVLYFIGMFGWFFLQLCTPFAEIGLEWLYFAIAGIATFVFSFITSVFTAQTMLYEAKDNDLLLSMPISPANILASRMAIMLLINYAFEALIFIPAGVIFCAKQPVSALGVLFFILVFILLPFFVMAFSCFFGWLVALISSKARNKNTVTAILSVCFIAVYFMVFSKIQNYITALIKNGEQIAIVIKKSLFPIYHLGNAVAQQDFLSLLFFALCCIVPFAIVYLILSKSFIEIATSKRGAKKIKYKQTALNVSSAKAALTKKELKHFFSNPMYMLNGGLGAAMAIVFVVVLAFKKSLISDLFAQVPNFKDLLGPIVCLLLCALSSTNIISAPSISLEGKNLWIAQSSPVDAGDVLLAKVNMHLIVCLPSIIIAATSCSIFLSLKPIEIILIYLIPSIFTAFTALFGVVVNLKFPRFDWINETVAIKQSASTTISMFGAMAVVALPVILYYFLLSDYLSVVSFMFIVAIAFAAVDYVLYRFLMTKGKTIFETL